MQQHTQLSADNVLKTLALAIARNRVGARVPDADIALAEGITANEFLRICTNPTYTRYVDVYTKELTDSGWSFSAKAKVLAEDLLPTVYGMAKDADVPAAVRQKLIENLVDWGDLKPKTTLQGAQGPGFSITINVPGVTTSTHNALTTVDAVEVPVMTLPKAPERERALIAFDEPVDYEYAGDDVIA
jgi:hypothetical protein